MCKRVEDQKSQRLNVQRVTVKDMIFFGLAAILFNTYDCLGLADPKGPECQSEFV
jgi:hypothetical protein